MVFMIELQPIGTSTHIYLHLEVPSDVMLPSKLATHQKTHHFTSLLFYAHKLCVYAFNLMSCVYVKSSLTRG